MNRDSEQQVFFIVNTKRHRKMEKITFPWQSCKAYMQSIKGRLYFWRTATFVKSFEWKVNRRCRDQPLCLYYWWSDSSSTWLGHVNDTQGMTQLKFNQNSKSFLISLTLCHMDKYIWPACFFVVVIDDL